MDHKVIKNNNNNNNHRVNNNKNHRVNNNNNHRVNNNNNVKDNVNKKNDNNNVKNNNVNNNSNNNNVKNNVMSATKTTTTTTTTTALTYFRPHCTSKTEFSAVIRMAVTNFNMSNTAKLKQGIKEVSCFTELSECDNPYMCACAYICVYVTMCVGVSVWVYISLFKRVLACVHECVVVAYVLCMSSPTPNRPSHLMRKMLVDCFLSVGLLITKMVRMLAKIPTTLKTKQRAWKN